MPTNGFVGETSDGVNGPYRPSARHAETPMALLAVLYARRRHGGSEVAVVQGSPTIRT
jgi:hypothetical protein